MTTFEVYTVVAFSLFSEEKIEIAFFEVGMGGRLDATNVLDSEDILCSVITNVGMDHVDYLGNTIEKIGHEKAGIIKENKFVVSGVDNELALGVIKDEAKNKNAQLIQVALKNEKSYIEKDINISLRAWDVISKQIKIKNLEIDKFLTNEKMKAYFLRGFFDGDGSMGFSGSGRKVHREIGCVNKDERLIKSISMYLTELGIENRIRKTIGSGFNPNGTYYVVYIYGKRNILNFYKKVGFSIKRKQEKLASALSSYARYRQIN